MGGIPYGFWNIGMGGGLKNVLVVDLDWNCVGFTRAAKARKLIDCGRVILVNWNPPIIQFQEIFKKKEGGKEMVKLRTLNDYFSTEKEVFVQNISGSVISLCFYETNGRVIPFTIPKDRRPFCLTDHIPKDLIQHSSDFLKFLSRNPPALRLLTREEYESMISRIAQEVGTTPESVVASINERLNKAQSKDDYEVPIAPNMVSEDKPVLDTEEDLNVKMSNSDINIPGAIDEGINPRIIQLVADCSPDCSKRIKANDAIAQLVTMDLTNEELNYILRNCAYKTVQAWAQKKLLENSSGNKVEEEQLEANV